MERLHPGVYIEEVPSGARPIEAVGTSTTAFLGWAPKGQVGKPELVTSFIEYERKFGSFYVTPEGEIKSYLAHSVFAYFNNGGRKAYVVRVAVNPETAVTTLKDQQGDALRISAFSPGAWANALLLDVDDGTDAPESEFRLIVKRKTSSDVDEILEVHDNLSMDRAASNFVEKVIVANSQLILAEAISANRPVSGQNIQFGAATAGSDGTTPQDADYQANLAHLDTIKDFSLLVIPGIGNHQTTVDASTYCEQRANVAGVNDCFFIGETDANTDTVDEAKKFITGDVNESIPPLPKKSPYAALYFPWLETVDPTGISPTPIKVPPSGFVAGMYASIDGRRGVFKAPAGTEANIGGASGLTKVLTDAEQDFLNNIGVNCIRAFPASGIVIWGARTLSTRSQPEWRYVPVRRLAILLEVSIYNGIQFAVFEPNDEDLWASLRLNITAFMMTLFRQGAFQGSTPQDAFFVKVDQDTTTQADIDAGTVNILVGFAPLKPAEFVVVKISQKAGQVV